MKVALVQFPIIWEDKAANFSQVRDLLANKSFPEGGLIVLPELFATGFTMEADAIAETDMGETERFLIELAEDTSAHVLGGFARLEPGGKPTNNATIAAPNGKILSRYQKTHPFSLGGEHERYSRGDEVITAEIDGLNVSPSVCYDLRFPEIYRIVAQHTDLFVVIANWPEKRADHWMALLKARAIENQAYVIGVNRVGEDPQLNYSGNSMVVDYFGEVILDAESATGVFETYLDVDGLSQWRDKFPALRDRHEGLSKG